jgi:cyclase
MKRLTLLAALVMVGSLSIAVAAYQQQPAAGEKPRVVEVEKLKDNLFVLRGGGGNSAVFVTAKGVVVVDTKNPGWGAPLIAKIRELTDKPITTIINTHTHGDHVSGNVEFEPNVDVVVHANAADSMKRMVGPFTAADAPKTPTIFEQNGGRGLPKRTFKDAMTIGSGNDRVTLRYFGRGHTNGDAWVIFPALRVMHAGDIFSGKNIPILDPNNGGSGVDMPDTLMKAANATAKDVDTIITGHSTQMTIADLREYSEFNRDFLNAVRDGKKAGKTADAIVAGWTIPAKYTGYAPPAADRVKSNVTLTFGEVK